MIEKPISNIWRGHGSAIFFEFGKLHETELRDGSVGQKQGEVTLMIEWSWRIEGPRSIQCGSWSEEHLWEKKFKALLGASVTDVIIFGALPEICVTLSNGWRVVSFMTAEGQPQWAIITRTPKLGSLSVKRGAVRVEQPSF